MKKSILFCLFVLSLQAGSSCGCSWGEEEGCLKQCIFRNINDGRDEGLIKTCTFNKSQDNTALRVTWQGNLRMNGLPHGGCRRWFITINGKECSSPAPIDAVIYANFDLDYHRPGTLDGFCENIPKGEVTVSISVGACRSNKPGNAYTGLDDVSRMIIEEVPPLQ